MKIGLTIRSFYPQYGGLQVHAEHLVRALQDKGHEVIILTRSVSHSPSYQDFFFFSESMTHTTVNGLSVTVLKHPRWVNPLMWVVSKCLSRSQLWEKAIKLVNLVFFRQAVSALQSVDVVHHVGQAHELIGFVAAAAAKALHVPFVVQPTAHPGQWGDSALDCFLYQKADRLLVHTEYERKFLYKISSSTNFDIVGNGVEEAQTSHANRFRQKYGIQGSLFLFLGRKSIDKGYPLVKAAFHHVYLRYPEAKLVCAGPSENSSVSIVAQDGILELDFISSQEKQDALAACTALCVPSVGESFGLVYMEAARYSKPSIARRLPVLEELWGKHNAAILVGTSVGSGNQVDLQPNELADAMIQILDEGTLAQSIGKNAFTVSEQFLWSNVVLRFETAYQNAIKNFNSIDKKL